MNIANHLLQSTVFAAVAALLAYALRAYRAETRYAVWLAASVKFLLPFSFLFDLGRRIAWCPPVVAAPALRHLAQPVEPFRSVIAFDQAPAAAASLLPAMLIALWAAGFLVIVTLWIVRWLRIRRSVHRAARIALPDGTEALTSHEFPEPGVYGIRRPVLLLPTRIVREAPDPQLRAIVAHEQCHIRRLDNMTALLHMAVEAIFWYHPLVWWIGSRLLEERERACDEEVLGRNDAETYANGILRVCELCLEPALPCVSGVTGGQLRTRIEQIMSLVAPRRLSRAGKSALLSGAGALLLACVMAGAQPVSFEAVSIKPVPPEVGGFNGQPGYILRPRLEDPLRFRSRIRAESLIGWSYRLMEYRIIGGPAWMRDPSVRFAIEAAAPKPSTRAGMERMVQTMLAERFHLKFHWETREMPVFLLTTANGGPKMEPTKLPELNYGDGTLNIGKGELIAHSINMDTLAGILTENSERPVLDRTGLTGQYEFTLHYEPSSLVDWRLGPALPSMLKDIGLRMEPSRQPVELMIIDSMERPTEN